MTKFTVKVSDAAAMDIRVAFRWYQDQEEGLGVRFIVSLDNAIESIRLGPKMFPIVYRGVRRALLKSFPYGVFFVLGDKQINVIGVLHSARNPEKIENRSK